MDGGERAMQDTAQAFMLALPHLTTLDRHTLAAPMVLEGFVKLRIFFLTVTLLFSAPAFADCVDAMCGSI